MIVNNQLFDMSLRQNFDSFTPQHKLRDAQEEFAQAVYRFRTAEEANAPNLIAVKREMEFLERTVEYCRHCLYTGQPIDECSECSELPERCPEPTWI